MRFARRRRGWLAGMAILIAVLAFLGVSGWSASVEDQASSFLGPLQRGFRQAGEPLAQILLRVDEFGRLDSENRALRDRVEQLETENARLREQQIQVRAREALLQVQTESQSPMIIANVVTRDLTGLRTLIGIDRGQADGLREGLPVLAAGGALVGVVVEARPNTSFVRLITDPDSVIRVLHQESRTESIANGDPLGNLYVQIPWTAQVELGHVFVTSGLDGLLPQGVPIGRAASTGGSIQDAFRQVRLQPLVPIDQIEQVLVQLSIPPPDLSDMTDPADATNQPAAAVSP